MIENNISPMYSDFEQIKKSTEDGQEYWSSRDLCNALGYSTYQKFARILNKTIAVANSIGMNTADHFNQTVEMVKLGSGTFQIENKIYRQPFCPIFTPACYDLGLALPMLAKATWGIRLPL